MPKKKKQKNKKTQKQKNKKILFFTNYQVYSIIADTANAPATSSLRERERERERELTNNNAIKLYKSSRTFCLISNNTWHPEEEEEEEEEILQNISLHSGKKQLI
jgi:hypothetical protein